MESDISYSEFPADWYSMSDERHFWMRWRLRVWQRRAHRAGIDLSGRANALDIGAGVGAFARQVESVSSWVVDGIERNPDALKAARFGRGRLQDLDIFAPPASMLAAYDHVFLFDVLEHIPDSGDFLRAAVRCLKPGGWLHVNVPALQGLHSAYDRAAGHVRRYDPARLAADLGDAPFAAPLIGYWGFSMLPLLVLRKAALARRSSSSEILRAGFSPPNRLADLMLAGVMRLETALTVEPFLGTSLMMLVRKNP